VNFARKVAHDAAVLKPDGKTCAQHGDDGSQASEEAGGSRVELRGGRKESRMIQRGIQQAKMMNCKMMSRGGEGVTPGRQTC
jgi:hypothetical protein